MDFDRQSTLAICAALGIGLLVGAERERRKGTGPARAAVGIRTFAVISLTGVVAMLLGGAMLMSVVILIVGAFAILAYRHSRAADPGLTTEIAMVLTCLLGGLSAKDPVLAAGLGTALAGLLAMRDRLHRFVRNVLSEREMHDALLFLAATLIVLPLAPNRHLGPFDSINPRALVGIVVLVMSVSALGYIALRILGPRSGLPLAGFVSGFISSSATIHAAGRRAQEQPALLPGLVAGAVLSSVATIIQVALLVSVLAPPLITSLARPLAFSGAIATLYATVFTMRAFRVKGVPDHGNGRAFDLVAAVVFAAIICAVLMIAAFLNARLGSGGTLLTAALSGLVDAHAAAAAASSQFAVGKISTADATIAVLAGLSTNALVKSILAFTSGGWAYALRIVPGLLGMIAAAWLGL